jgi:hypothetical protein
LRSPPRPKTVDSARAEHISLESDFQATESPVIKRKVRSKYALRSRLRGCQTEIAILDEHFAAVTSLRPGREMKRYEFDLRFANAKPVRVRRIAWSWAALTTVFGSLAGIAAWLFLDPTLDTSTVALLAVGATMLVGAFVCGFVFLRRTTESLEFTSVHGNATLISITGGIGSARAGKAFFVNLIKSINAAKALRPQTKQQWLRDEMREHHRLRELRVLTEAEYEASKARILAAHG